MINKQFATSLHIMTSLAMSPHKLSNSEGLAESVNTNPVVIRRLLLKLVKSGLVETQRGKAGGVRLAKNANKITLKDIYVSVVDSKLIKRNNSPTKKECPVSCAMGAVMCQVIEGVESSALNHLQSFKLSDIIKKIKT